MKRVFDLRMWTVLIVLVIGVSSCKKDDDGNGGSGNNKIVGTWVDVSGKIGKYGPGGIGTYEGRDVCYWEFTADGYMNTNCDAMYSSTYEYDSKTNMLYLWGGVRKTTVTWISDTEIETGLIGRLKKQ